ncbi:MAG: glycosyltransferase family 10 domain-containing protein [bacterium]
MKKFTLYTHINWVEYAWESVNPSKYIEWDIRRCYYGDPHPHPDKHTRIFYTDSELSHALTHVDVEKYAFMLESRHITPHYYDYIEENIDSFDGVLTYDKRLLNNFPQKCIYYAHCNCLIARCDFDLYEKSKLVSFISSQKNMNVSGHLMRHAFYGIYISRGSNWSRSLLGSTEVDLFGYIADNYVESKLDSVRNYMFQVVVENSLLDNYFTEKIIDCFVTGTIPIYYGAGNIGEFFDANGILEFKTLEELFTILGSLTPDLYYDRQAAVVANYKKAQQYIVPEDWIYENTSVFG